MIRFGDIEVNERSGKFYMRPRGSIKVTKEFSLEGIRLIEAELQLELDDNKRKRYEFGLEKYKEMLQNMNNKGIDYVNINVGQWQVFGDILNGRRDVPIKVEF